MIKNICITAVCIAMFLLFSKNGFAQQKTLNNSNHFKSKVSEHELINKRKHKRILSNGMQTH